MSTATTLDPAAKARRACVTLKHASDPSRASILLLLEDGPRTVTEITAHLGRTSQPATSHHLALMRHGKIIEPTRAGKNICYSLTEHGRRLSAVVRGLMAKL